MTTHFLDKKDQNPDTGYTIRTIENCRIVMGAYPIRDFPNLCRGLSDEAVVATDIASRLGASMVIGEPADIQRLREAKLPVSEQRKQDAQAARAVGAPESVIEWLLEGNRGLSSDALCKAFYGVPKDAGINHPHDFADLNRCLEFLLAVGDDYRDRFDQVTRISPVWARLVKHWDELIGAIKKDPQAPDFQAADFYSLIERIEGGE